MGAAEMNIMQRKACEELVKAGDGDQTAACIRAGYKDGKGTKVTASRLFAKLEVQAYIAKLRAPAMEDAQLTLASHLRDLQDLRDAAKAAAQYGPAVTAEISRGKASGLYVEKVQHSGDVKSPLVINLRRGG